MLDNVKIIDGFVWLIVTDSAKELWSSGALTIYRLYDDGTESRIESYDDINDALENGEDIGVEIGSLSGLNDAYAYQRRKYEVGVDYGEEGTKTIATFMTEQEAKVFMREYSAINPSRKVFIDTCTYDFLNNNQ